MESMIARVFCIIFGVIFATDLHMLSAFAQILDDETAEIIQEFILPDVPHSRLAPILGNIESGEFNEAIKLAEAELERPSSTYPSDFYAAHIRAASHYYMAYAYRALGDCERSLENYTISISMGNSGAADEFSDSLIYFPDFVECVYSGMTKAELFSVLRNSARLGNVLSAALITNFREEDGMSDEESIYWMLNTVGGERVKSVDVRREILSRFVGEMGEDNVEDAFRKYSLIGDPTISQEGNVPGRSLAQATFVENNLRGQYGRLHAGSDGWSGPLPEAPTVLENFRLYQLLVPEQGFGHAYLLISSPTAVKDAGIIQLDQKDMFENINIGDRLLFNCGALSHIAILFKVDMERRKFGFIDAAYQFWQPSHNSCFTDFELKEEEMKKFISYVDIDEAMSSLVAVITFRD